MAYNYSVRASNAVLGPTNDTLAVAANLAHGVRRFAVVDSNVFRIYGEQLNEYFDSRGVELCTHVISSGESQKRIETVLSIVEAIEKFGIRRYSDPIIAIGGGALTDTVGLAAHLYRRGTPHIRVPTTLVGLVDAGIGVKVGVNFKNRKNLLGSFEGPVESIIDCNFLNTLPLRHLRNGMAEVIKIAVVCDESLFELLEEKMSSLGTQSRPFATYAEVVERAITAMLGQLAPNPWERDLRRPVDFGHTFSPKLEMESDGGLLHGEAVAIDMALCCAIAQGRGILDQRNASRVLGLLKSAGLPLHHRLCTAERLSKALEESTSHRDGMQHIFLPRGVGRGEFVEDLSRKEITSALEWIRQKYGEVT